eukprot:scaffold281_cov282-Ochromonas_danica.AAC.4
MKSNSRESTNRLSYLTYYSSHTNIYTYTHLPLLFITNNQEQLQPRAANNGFNRVKYVGATSILIRGRYQSLLVDKCLYSRSPFHTFRVDHVHEAAAVGQRMITSRGPQNSYKDNIFWTFP